MRTRWLSCPASSVLVLAAAIAVAGAAAGGETPGKPSPPDSARSRGPSVSDEEDEIVKLGDARGYRLGDLEWEPGPLPGTRIALLAGDPAKGMHHTYLQLADGTVMPPHWHSTDEYVTIVSGALLFGVGENLDRNAARMFTAGAFLFIPAKTPHYVVAKGQVVISQTRSGALDVHWVHPEDDPAKKKQAAAGAGAK